ncbi:hypothetical protein ILP97_04555 [Amycolatopsis sp. H6(2020)]|nr:hypothetical protein [Amycolatopsis sp. H6(2020)]
MPDEETKHEFSLTEIQDFHKTLNSVKATMPDEQQRLLDSILTVAWAAVECDDKLVSGFSGSFTPEQGSLLADFAVGGGVSVRPQLFRGFIKLG